MSTTSTDTIIENEEGVHVIPFEDSEDKGERQTHIINPPQNTHIWRPGMTSQDVVNIARSSDLPIQTLCGKIFIPKRDPEKFPACNECIQIAGELMRQAGE